MHDVLAAGHVVARTPMIHLLDETFVVASPQRLRADWCDEAAWADLLPDCALDCYDDRGPLGKRWRMSGRLLGTAEVWLESLPTGVVVHAYVRVDPARSMRRGGLRRLHGRLARGLKRHGFAVKDAAEEGRAAGEGSLAQQTGDHGDDRWRTRPPATS